MSRTLPTGLAAALSAAEVVPAFLVEIDWPDGTVYMWNGYATISWNGHSWLGLGHLGSIEAVKETTDLTATGVKLVLSGIPSANVAEALRNDTQGSVVRIYFGVLSGNVFAIDPYLMFNGFVDTPSILDDGKTATITVNCENELVDNRSGSRRYTMADQQIDYPSDLGLQYVSSIALQTFTWGKVTVAPAVAGGGAGTGDGATNLE